MIVRISLLLTFFIISCSCGTSQGPISLDNSENIPFVYNKLSANDKTKYADEVKAKYEKLIGNRGFSGQILVAKNGEIIFEDYKGYSNYKDKSLILAETPIHLASVSKTFTGMVALKLWEEKKLDLKAPVSKYLPKFPYSDVTIEELLSHRSGLPDYTYFMETRKYVSIKSKNRRGRWVKKLKLISNEAPFKNGIYNNQDVLDFMVAKHPAPAANPDRVFKYCNTNYVLLALIMDFVNLSRCGLCRLRLRIRHRIRGRLEFKV